MSAPWVQLYALVEGQTERAFAEATLGPHLAAFNIELRPVVRWTSRKHGVRGGVVSFDQVCRDLRLLLQQHRQDTDRFTTMLDLYALPTDFPGWQAAQEMPAIDKVTALEQALADSVGDQRFLPYLQLHEFEALLFCDLTELVPRITDSERGIKALQRDVHGLAPEAINDGHMTAPSKRIIRHVPAYERSKVRVGALAAAAIGLDRLRSRCPHLDRWVAKLEQVGARLDEAGADA